MSKDHKIPNSVLALMKKTPLPLSPAHKGIRFHKPLALHTGELKLSQGIHTVQGVGTVWQHWLPKPRIDFSLPIGSPAPIEPGYCSLQIPDAAMSGRGFLSSIQIGSHEPFSLTGHVVGQWVSSSATSASYALFHLPNFHCFMGDPIGELLKDASKGTFTTWAGRAILVAADWKVTIDAVSNQRDLLGMAKSTGGYALAHVGKLERTDKKGFSYEEANEIASAIQYYLTFVRGFWVAPMLLAGFDAEGNKVWEEWTTDRLVDPWQSVDSWFPVRRKNILSNLFPGFIRCWHNAVWARPVKMAIHWYVDSNTGSLCLERALIVAVATLELLACVFLVEDRKLLSAKDVDARGLSAYKQIERLLAAIQVPSLMPSELEHLRRFAKRKSGPRVLTKLRNAIVHATTENRKILDVATSRGLFEAWKLSVWYIELALLHLFGYKGPYHSRLPEGGNVSDTECVPWTGVPQ